MMLDIESEKKSLTDNLFVIRQKKYRFQQLASNRNETEEYYQDLSERILRTIVQYEAFYFEYKDYKRNGQAKVNGIEHPELSQLHKDLQDAYKEAVEYLKTLLQLVEKRIQRAKIKANPNMKHTFVNEPLEDKTLKKIFVLLKMDAFKIIDERLQARGYLNRDRVWQGHKLELVALICVLIDNRFFRNFVSTKDIKNFFQSLYQIDINQQFKPSKRELADKYKSIFSNMI